MKYLYLFGGFLLTLLSVFGFGWRKGREKIKEKSRKQATRTTNAMNKASIESVAKADQEVKDAISRAHHHRDHFS